MPSSRGGAAPGGEDAAASIRRIAASSLKATFVLGLTIALGGCGIEEYLYFYPPTVSSNPVVSVTPLSFGHNSSNKFDAFRGYEIYYLLIDAENTDFLNSCSSKIDSYIGSKTPSEIIALIKSLGFVPFVGIESDGSANTNMPLFKISITSSSYDGDIDFSVSINRLGTVTVTGTGAGSVTAPVSVRRNSKDSNGAYRTFENLTEDAVADGGDTAYLSAKPDTVLFRAYIVAYGINDATWSETYSNAVRVGHYTSTTDYSVIVSTTDSYFE
jgi:hypothetical protein